MGTKQQKTVSTEMEHRGESLPGIYHSHPKGPAGPSEAACGLPFIRVLSIVLFPIVTGSILKTIKIFILSEKRFKEVAYDVT